MQTPYVGNNATRDADVHITRCSTQMHIEGKYLQIDLYFL